jgi:hypothetical protein
MTDNLNSIILEIPGGQKTIEDLRTLLETETIKEITVDKSTFALALQCSKATKETIVHAILLHFVQKPGEQSLKDAIEHLEKAIGDRIYAKNNPIRNPNEEFCTHMDFTGEKRNTLLHQAVRNNETEAIKALFNYDINPFIKNKKGETPLDLAIEEVTKKALTQGMKKQASLKKESARCSSLLGIIPGVFLGIGIGIGSALAGPSMAIMLGTMAVSALVVGIAIGLAIYFSSQDYKQAKAIENAINPKSVSNEVSSVPARVGNRQHPLLN